MWRLWCAALHCGAVLLVGVDGAEVLRPGHVAGEDIGERMARWVRRTVTSRSLVLVAAVLVVTECSVGRVLVGVVDDEQAAVGVFQRPDCRFVDPAQSVAGRARMRCPAVSSCGDIAASAAVCRRRGELQELGPARASWRSRRDSEGRGAGASIRRPGSIRHTTRAVQPAHR